jgi:hypothetical protein
MEDQMFAIEMYKINDTLQIKYGVNPVYLKHAVQHYKILEDEDVIEETKQFVTEQKRAAE